ncbi:hypothetical protein [Rubrivivax gelatinosus]|uniref:hypothetical protein n=1 Tax=Rubrivivax gelatinosus TaxID=28068 RepID=UPI0005C196E4|nr:hypothetical protein [Rubrivivax gelatinosus]MBG6083051.1 hypothetical protein [Rubrivivax gelatinosus]
MRCAHPLSSQPQTPLQRRYYWAIVRHAARHCLPDGKPADAQKCLHNEFKGQILGYEEVLDSDGRPALEPISTTGLDHAEFSDFIEAVLSVLVDANVPLPDSPEQLLEVCPRVLSEDLPVAPRRASRR